MRIELITGLTGYRGKTYNPGDIINVEDKYGEHLIRLTAARPAPPAPDEPKKETRKAKK